MVINIRTATTADAAVLSELGAKTFYDTFRPHNTEEDMQAYISKAYSPSQVEANFGDADITYLIAENEEQPTGYAKLIRNVAHPMISGKSVELEKIYVVKEAIRSGVGAELMKAAIALAKVDGFEVMFLGVWQENKRAVDFYKEFGFETFATRQFTLGQQVCDDHLMKLVL